MMQRLGMNVEPIPNAKQVIIRTENKEILINNPEVAAIEMQGQRMFQIVGGSVSEKDLEREEAEKVEIPDEDAQLVASQTKTTLAEARKVLEETKGDLAKAILLLQSKS